MPRCVLCGRTQNSRSREERITFHKYPKCPETREKWIEFSRCYDKHGGMLVNRINEKSVVCSVHFVAGCFDVYIKTTKLKPRAVPSVIVRRVCFGREGDPETTVNSLSNENQEVNTAEEIGCSSSTILNYEVLEPEMDGIVCLELNSFGDYISNDSGSPISTISSNELSAKVSSELFVQTSIVEDKDIPGILFLKRRISRLTKETNLKSKTTKILNQTI